MIARSSRRPLRAAAVALALAALAPRARADAPPGAASTAPDAKPVDEARRHFQRGVKFYTDADFRSALVEFQEAYRVSPSYRLLFNIGQTYEELQDFAGAVGAFRAYLAQGGGELTKARRAEVESELRRLEGHVASVDVVVSEPGAELSAEGDRRIDLGTSPLAAPVLLNGGSWTIAAKKSGFAGAEEHLTVAGGDKKTVRLTLARSPALPAPPAPSPAPSPAPPASVDERPPPAEAPAPPARSMTPVWIGVAVTGALAVGAGVTGALALGAKGDYDAQLARFGATADDVQSARTRTRTFALATDVLAGAAIVGAVVTVALYVLGAPQKKTAAPSIGLDGAGVHGAF